MQRVPTILIVIGVSVIAFAITSGWFLLPTIINGKIKQEVCLKNGSDTFQRWKHIPVPIYMKVYLFNVTNPDDVITGAKPILKEVGPYVYSEKREKLVEDISEENDTITFRPKISYFFRRDMSVGGEDDVLTFINIPLISMAYKLTNLTSPERYVFLEIVKLVETKLFIQKTVGEFLFEGYPVEMFEVVTEFTGAELIPNNTFSMYGAKNGSTEDLLEIFSGVKNNEEFGTTLSWNGQTKLTTYDSEYCNMINGSDGSIFPPFVTRDRVLNIFSPDMCRSMYMTYQEDAEIYGIQGYRFTTPKEILEDPRTNPDNRCYCETPGNDGDGCLPGGVFEIAVCRKGAPIVASWPHFFEANQYINQSVGLSPNRDLHETFIILEPHTASILLASKRFQVNIDLKRSKYFKCLKKVSAMLFPVMWVDESAGVDGPTSELLKMKLIKPLHIASMSTWSVMAFGSSLLLAAILIMLVTSKRKPEKPDIKMTVKNCDISRNGEIKNSKINNSAIKNSDITRKDEIKNIENKI